jgi:hypothetical protein
VSGPFSISARSDCSRHAKVLKLAALPFFARTMMDARGAMAILRRPGTCHFWGGFWGADFGAKLTI